MNDQVANAGDSAAVGVALIIELAILLVVFIAMWRVFTKARQPGWAALIPIYNVYVLLQIAGKPWWWLLLLLIPIVNFVISILTTVAVAEKFGKGVGFAIGLIFLPFIFYPILGFGDAEYQG